MKKNVKKNVFSVYGNSSCCVVSCFFNVFSPFPFPAFFNFPFLFSLFYFPVLSLKVGPLHSSGEA